MKIKNDIKILYVEDEENIRVMLSRFISRFCSDLYVGVNGQEGLELYEKYHPDIIISDIKMPVMTGIDMAKKIKAIDKEQIIIFTTAHNESGFLLESIEMQVDCYILKPIELDLLGEKIQKFINLIHMKKNYSTHLEILKEIAYLQNDLLLVLDENHSTIFANNKAIEFFNVQEYTDISFSKDLFIQHPDFYNSDGKVNCIDELMSLSDDKRVVAIEDKKDHKIKAFLVTLKQTEHSSHTIVVLSEITNLKIDYIKTKIKAYTDDLTSIPNRAKFQEELEKFIISYSVNHTKFSLFMLDIDFFKNINDQYGHDIGDDVLKELATLISSHVRQTDLFARWGGEEFMYLLANTDLEGCKKAAENIRSLIENHQFSHGERVTASFGCARFEPDDTQDSFIKRVDNALYKAKELGRNRVESS